MIKEKIIKTIKPIKQNSSNIPTLILWGEKDAMLPFASQEKFVGFIKNRKMHIFPSGHHYSYLKQPELTLKIMENFLLA